MPDRRLLLILAALSSLACADPHAERRWTGVNGKTFTGAYMGTDPKSGKYSFVLSGGKSYLIDPENLSEEDREWLDLALHPEKRPHPEATDPGAFLPDPDLDRTDFPIINQSDYGSKASDCVPSAFCNFVLWWDMEGYLPIDKKGGFDKKAEYIHSRMARYFKTRNTAGTDLRDAREGAKAYFEKELAELATVRVLSDYNCDPDNLRRYTSGANATLLGVSVYYGRKDEGGHVVALSHVEENGDLVMFTWGARIRGRLKIIERDLRLPEATTSTTGHKYEVEFMNRGDLPDWMAEYDVRFEIDPDRWDGLMVISPYRYKTPGSALPPPPDPLMQPEAPKRPERDGFRRPVLAPPPLPHEFRHAPRYSREWSHTAGARVTGRVESCDNASLVLDVDGSRRSIPLSELTPDDQARALLWRGVNGQDPVLPDARLDYLLTKGEEVRYPVRIFLSKTRFRLELPFIRPTRTIIVDTGSGEFIVHRDNTKNYIGRLAPDDRLPAPPEGRDLGTWEDLRDRIPHSKPGTHPEWPCLLTTWERPEDRFGSSRAISTFERPAMLFSGVQAPNLTAALETLLSPGFIRKESARNGTGIMHGKPPSDGHDGAGEVLGFCRQAHLLPIRLQWTNTLNRESEYAKYHLAQAGTFRLELGKLTLGPQPDHLFEIPEAAATVEPGYFRQIAPTKK